MELEKGCVLGGAVGASSSSGARFKVSAYSAAYTHTRTHMSPKVSSHAAQHTCTRLGVAITPSHTTE